MYISPGGFFNSGQLMGCCRLDFAQVSSKYLCTIYCLSTGEEALKITRLSTVGSRPEIRTVTISQ